MYAPLPGPIAIIVFVMFVWRITTLLRGKSRSSGSNDEPSEFRKFCDLPYEEKCKVIEKEQEEIMRPIIEQHYGYQSETFSCCVVGRYESDVSHFINVGDKMKLRFCGKWFYVCSSYGVDLAPIYRDKNSALGKAWLNKRPVEAYMSRRPYHSYNSEDFDSFDVTVFYLPENSQESASNPS